MMLGVGSRDLQILRSIEVSVLLQITVRVLSELRAKEEEKHVDFNHPINIDINNRIGASVVFIGAAFLAGGEDFVFE